MIQKKPVEGVNFFRASLLSTTPYYYDEKIIAYSQKCTMLSSLALPNLYYLISEEQAKSQKEMEVSRLMYKVDCHILLTSGETGKCYLLVNVSPLFRHIS